MEINRFSGANADREIFKIHFHCSSADHLHFWQSYPVDPSAICVNIHIHNTSPRSRATIGSFEYCLRSL